MQTMHAEVVHARRALEALRNGVPNADAVRVLGCAQPHVLDRFDQQLDILATATKQGTTATTEGIIVTGDFGTGKSHLLEHLEQHALDRGFVVSRIVISKETPLYDPAKVFAAAVRDARFPGGRGSVIHELALRVDYRTPSGSEFMAWALDQPGLIAATVHLHERSNDNELHARILDFWSGEKIGVAEVRAGLKQVGSRGAFDVKTIKIRDLALLRFEFAARLARAVGCNGWVLLIDEVELLGRYSLQQRAKSYAELARWLGRVEQQAIPGITTVATISEDFDLKVLREKDDFVLVPERIRAKGGDDNIVLAARAEIGMRLIERDRLTLILPTAETLRTTYDRLREVYERAYGPCADLEVSLQTATTPMRRYIRGWITEWDIRRLYPGERPEIETESITVDYDEDTALQQEPEGFEGTDDGGRE